MRLAYIEAEPLEGVVGVALAKLLDADAPRQVRVDVAILEAGASLPRHPAGREQVFYVLEGSGHVAGADDVPFRLDAGWAATWEPGEAHTSWADTRMTVLIIQAGAAR